jgi:PmbA protein
MDPKAAQRSLQAIAADAVSLARRLGAGQAEAGANLDEGLSVSVRLGEVENVERQRDRGLGVTVYRDGRKGSASTSDFSSLAVSETVEKALSLASFTARDEFAGLAPAELMAKEPPDLDLYHPWALDVEAATERALAAESAARSFDPRIANSEGSTVSTSCGVQVYANSHGFCDGYPTSGHSISCGVVAKSGESLERDHWFTLARSPEELEPAEAIGEEAARRALRRLGARQLSTRIVPVLFPAELARGLVGHLLPAISGSAQYRKASFLLDSLGETIFPEFVDIEEDPLIPRGLASSPFDAEGVVANKRMLVESGVLRGYMLSSYSARRLGMRTTGNAGGAHNLIVRPTAGSAEELLGTCPEVFVVGELLGQGVNTVTGDYSRGAAGLWFENGELVHPVSEVTLAGNLREMFRRIRAIGSDVDKRGTVRCGSLLIDGLTLAGGSTSR